MMEPTVRDSLRQLMVRHGQVLCDDPSRCKDLLDKLCGQHKREVNSLISALTQRVPADLLADNAGLPTPQLIAHLGRRLEDDLGLTAETAQWAVETWAVALGAITGPVAPPDTQSVANANAPTAQTDAKTRANAALEPPDIHGWPARKVQDLQDAAAKTLGLLVTFRDPLRAPVSLPHEGSRFTRFMERGAEVITAAPEMILIPAGRFLMGSPEEETTAEEDAKRPLREHPQHQVTISRPFALGRYTVTFNDYDAFCTVTGGRKPNFQKLKGRGLFPVIRVSWEEAQTYCQWLSDQTEHAYRLPTEAEWEYACRAGTTTPFHFGATLTTDQANYDGNFPYGAGSKGRNRNTLVRAGSLPANPWGLYEMHGNIEEWCQDCPRDYSAEPVTDPIGPSVRIQYGRAVRGGCFYFGAADLRSASRHSAGDGSSSYGDVGFRVVREVV